MEDRDRKMERVPNDAKREIVVLETVSVSLRDVCRYIHSIDTIVIGRHESKDKSKDNGDDQQGMH